MPNLNLNNLNLNYMIDYETHKVHIKGNAQTDFYYIAPKGIDRRLAYSGSGLPYPNEEIAFENTPTKGLIKRGNFSITFDYPGGHYEFCSAKLIKPYIKFYNNVYTHHIVLGSPLIFNRSLMDLPNSPWHTRTTYGGYGSGGLN